MTLAAVLISRAIRVSLENLDHRGREVWASQDLR